MEDGSPEARAFVGINPAARKDTARRYVRMTLVGAGADQSGSRSQTDDLSLRAERKPIADPATFM